MNPKSVRTGFNIGVQRCADFMPQYTKSMFSDIAHHMSTLNLLYQLNVVAQCAYNIIKV